MTKHTVSLARFHWVDVDEYDENKFVDEEEGGDGQARADEGEVDSCLRQYPSAARREVVPSGAGVAGRGAGSSGHRCCLLREQLHPALPPMGDPAMSRHEGSEGLRDGLEEGGRTSSSSSGQRPRCPGAAVSGRCLTVKGGGPGGMAERRAPCACSHSCLPGWLVELFPPAAAGLLSRRCWRWARPLLEGYKLQKCWRIISFTRILIQRRA
uniref:Uncharacterized protein n=1 Tax=Strix occidentalis caurina TaxID=311401 RepID=A0A8D0KZ38_STROC